MQWLRREEGFAKIEINIQSGTRYNNSLHDLSYRKRFIIIIIRT